MTTARRHAWLGFRKVLAVLSLAVPQAPAGPLAASTNIVFTRDVAPLVFEHCSGCHRPGQGAPFDLLTYADCRRRAKQMAEVTASHYMPPWLPEPGYGEFEGERRLSPAEIDLLRRWAEGGAPEGDPSALPQPPRWTEGWSLGQPDLVVKVPRPYTLPAEGLDVYRNLVFPIPLKERRFVRGVEFKPGNPRVVHHAFINVDDTPMSRRQAAGADPPGIDGMVMPETSYMPGGQFLGWQPGKAPSFSPEGLSWVLKPGSDCVLQLHMHPSGKPEEVQPTLGFFFTDQPPTNQMVRLNLSQLFIDIPAGSTHVWVEQSYVLPVDVRVVGISPHCHYLGKEIQGVATLPDGSRQWLLWIRNWDFNWQGDYRYKTPQFLPRGTHLQMRLRFDNSTNNISNPHHPPVRVRYGLQTTDEMAELWFQVLAGSQSDYDALLGDFHRQLARWSIEFNQDRIARDPQDAEARTKVGRALHFLGQPAAALEQLRAAVDARPDYDRAHYELGYLHLRQGRLAEARTEFETVLRLNPADYEAEGNLGLLLLRQGRMEEAKVHFRKALEINPADAIARRILERMEAMEAQGGERP